jgi:hypothetical protein
MPTHCSTSRGSRGSNSAEAASRMSRIDRVPSMKFRSSLSALMIAGDGR